MLLFYISKGLCFICWVGKQFNREACDFVSEDFDVQTLVWESSNWHLLPFLHYYTDFKVVGIVKYQHKRNSFQVSELCMTKITVCQNSKKDEKKLRMPQWSKYA